MYICIYIYTHTHAYMLFITAARKKAQASPTRTSVHACNKRVSCGIPNEQHI